MGLGNLSTNHVQSLGGTIQKRGINYEGVSLSRPMFQDLESRSAHMGRIFQTKSLAGDTASPTMWWWICSACKFGRVHVQELNAFAVALRLDSWRYAILT